MSPPAALALFTLTQHPHSGQDVLLVGSVGYGDYVAKICVAPLSDSVKALQGVPALRGAGQDAHTDMVVQFFESNSAEYELRVQLCTDLVPIEDATVVWPESASPQRGVAKIMFPVQNGYSPKRRVFGDDVLSFNSWRTLKADRPLGSINRLTKEVYEASSRFRHIENKVKEKEPTDISELPDESSLRHSAAATANRSRR